MELFDTVRCGHRACLQDGRGLAGGNWIVRNSPKGRAFLREVYGPEDVSSNPFMRHDLRDQFSLLWHLVRPGVSVPMPPETRWSSLGSPPPPPVSWASMGYMPGVRLVPQELLLGAYPHVSCSQPGDRAHTCYGASGAADAKDFIVSVPLLGALPQNLAQAMLDRFLLESLGSLGQPAYEQELRNLCPTADISRCMVGENGGAAGS
ncbi:unnamed protein product [Polarella glacialis]|uniref:Uncharacterized protein n=1 Tax=Polarella glacialis TaxID=89957 RepID=A0A813I1L6_POLGL|nr:unnamed protein product [Polarella glacialis]